MTKTCTTCKQEKPLDLFTNDKYKKDGKTVNCKSCRNKIYKEYFATEKGRNNQRARVRKYSTGFTSEEFEEKLNNQGNVCAICGTDDSGKLDFCADHDHNTLQKRGVLCRKCNSGLGHFQDDIETIKKAVEYLEYYKAQLEG
jgi:hypothetical protein